MSPSCVLLAGVCILFRETREKDFLSSFAKDCFLTFLGKEMGGVMDRELSLF